MGQISELLQQKVRLGPEQAQEVEQVVIELSSQRSRPNFRGC
jgi:hypothetical protein